MNNNNHENQLVLVKARVLEIYPISENTFENIAERLNYDMSFHNITAEQLTDEIEAAYLDPAVKESITDEISMRDLILKCLNTLITKYQNRTSTIQQEEREALNKARLNFGRTNRIQIESINCFNQKGHTNPLSLNAKDISYSFFSDFEIKEYSLIPKDEETVLDDYKNYFKDMKQQFMTALNIEEDNPLLDVDKFILLVSFDNTEGKPTLGDLCLIDPLRDYKKFTLKLESDTILKDYYFISGQLIYLEGHAKNHEIYANKITFGLPLIEYSITEKYLSSFFGEASPYLIYAVNGPILNKKDFNLSLFLSTLANISNDNPHALILNGPLLNVDNEALAPCDINIQGESSSMNYFEIFELILTKINIIFAEKRTTIILCPSLADITNYYPLPIPSYNFNFMKNLNSLTLIKRGKLKLIGNPQIFQLNEMIVGVANFDVTKEMINNSLRSQNKVPIDSSLEMLLQQRSFFPILHNSVNPPEDIDKMEKTLTVDIRKMENFSMKAIPDIVITSSAFNPFIKKISSTLFINPGPIYKNNNEGWMAKIISYPPNNYTGIGVVDRLKVDICKLKSFS